MVNTWVKPLGYQDSKLFLQQKVMEDLLESGIKLPGM
jgi:hypothetical protein